MSDRIEPTLDGALNPETPLQSTKKPHQSPRKRRSIFVYVGYFVGIVVLLILLFPFWMWLIFDFWPKQVRYYSHQIGFFKYTDSQIRKTLSVCLRDRDDNCVQRFTPLLKAYIPNDPFITGLYGATLSREGKYKEAIPLMNIAAGNNQTPAFTVRELCIANTSLKDYKAALPWCAIAASTTGFKNKDGYPIVRAYVDALMSENQKIPALAAILKFDAIPRNFTQTDMFHSERAKLESGFGEPTNSFFAYKLSDNSYESVIRIGNGKFMLVAVRPGIAMNVMSFKDFQESGSKYTPISRESARSKDGTIVSGQLVELDSMTFGGIAYNKIQMFVCDTGSNCETFVGENTLKYFKATTEMLHSQSALKLTRK